MAEVTASGVPRRQLGRMLRDLRSAAGVTLDAAAVALECSRQKVWRIETGAGTVRGIDVRAMCELYGVAADLTAALVALAGATRARGWWHAYAEVPAWLGLHAGLEATALRLREYADALVPALLRTPGYARALHEPDPESTDDDRERLERAWRERQNLLRRRLPPPPRLAVVLSEAALLRVAGRTGLGEAGRVDAGPGPVPPTHRQDRRAGAPRVSWRGASTSPVAPDTMPV